MVKRLLHILFFVVVLQQSAQQLNAQQPALYEVKRMSFNSDAFSEISPVVIDNGIVFCSNRRFSGPKDRTSWDGSRLYNIYQAVRKDTSDWEKPKELKSERSSLWNNGPLCFAPDGKTVYFTSELETGKVAKKRKFKNHSGIFIADRSGNDLQSIRPFKYNNPQYNTGQPSVSSDGRYIFFTSDMPGGKGGSDLYYCELINGEWAAPVNIGANVNSTGDEGYPYMHASGKLYFTSNRSGGIGKLDIYYTSLYSGTWDDPVLLPEPINSRDDDFSFAAPANLSTGYFTSNRRKSDDIWEFTSKIIRKAICDTLVENSYCFRFFEENAIKFDTLPFRYEWKFGDGTKGVGAMVEHCYKGPGTYYVQLDVVNLVTKVVLYNEKTDTLVLTAIEQPYISAPDVVNSGQSIKLNSDSTNLPGWKIARFYWNFGDESVDIGREVDKTYLKPGIYNVQLIVSTEPEPGGMVREACISKYIKVIPKP